MGIDVTTEAADLGLAPQTLLMPESGFSGATTDEAYPARRDRATDPGPERKGRTKGSRDPTRTHGSQGTS